mgnify:CR=1 FL=1
MKAPVFCRFSSFRKTLFPESLEKNSELTRGVLWIAPSIASLALLIKSQMLSVMLRVRHQYIATCGILKLRWNMFNLMVMAVDLAILMATTITVIASYSISYLVSKIEKKFGLVAVDIHKPGKVVVARTGGIALILSLSLALAVWGTLGRVNSVALIYVLSAIIAGLMGLFDDFKHLNVRTKLILFSLPALLPVVLGLYVPHPFIPLIGHLRLTIVYPILVIVAFDVLANAFNMSDTHNGVIVSAFLIFSISLYISTFLPGPRPMEGFEILLAIATLVVVGYLPLNAYPAKMLNGNSGSHLIGTLVAALTIASRREFLAIMLLIPQILNGYLVLLTAGLRSKESIERPTKLSRDGIILPNCSPNAPITFVKLMVIDRGLREKELVIRYIMLQVIASTTSLLLYFVMTSL